ncbi:hypothetical protein [uncultured Porphyromonas sp.]|nr:hypothetical protein [uncultured Porphyromonas sp.]
MNDNNAPHYTELPIAQLDDWGIDLPDFTESPPLYGRPVPTEVITLSY